MTINIRETSQDFDLALKELMLKHDINANTKAVLFCVVDYKKKCVELDKLKLEHRDLKHDYQKIRWALDSIQDAFKKLFPKKKKDQ